MSIQSLIQNYVNNFNVKGHTPAWLSDLTKTVNSRNISINDWNIAMDNIRKVASDSVTVNNFIQGFGKEFVSYYERAIEKIEYITDEKYYITPQDIATVPDDLVLKSKALFTVYSLNTLKNNLDSEEVFYAAGKDYVNYTEDVGFVLKFPKNTAVGYLQLYVHSVAEPVTIYIDVGHENEDGSIGWIRTDAIALTPFTSSPPYMQLAYINNNNAEYIKVYQPKNTAYTNGRFAIKTLDVIKPNVEGYYNIVDYLGNRFKLPMVDPEDFHNQMLNHVITAEVAKEDAQLAQAGAEAAKDLAFEKVQEILGAENEKNGFVRLDGDAKIPVKLIPSLVVVNRQTYYAYDDTEEDINNYLVSLIRNGEAQPNDYVDIIKMVNVPSINDPDVFIEREVIQRSYVYIGSALVDRLSDAQILNGWKIIGTDYASFAAHSATSDKAYTTDRIQDVLFRIGNIDEYNASDKKGVYIVSKYTTEELTNG